RYPFFLSSFITNDDMLLIADLSNPDIAQSNGSYLKRGSLHFFRSKFLSETACHEEIAITNFGDCSCEVPLSFHFRSDFVDMFEIRGVKRRQHGNFLPTEINP